MNEFIFNFLKEQVARFTAGVQYHIYPLRVPDGIEFTEGCTYSILNITQTFGISVAEVQVTCISDTYDKAFSLAQDVANVAHNRTYTNSGDVQGMNVSSITPLGEDEELHRYLVAVRFSIKTSKFLV